MPVKPVTDPTAKAAAQTKSEDAATGDVKRGLVTTNVAMTEDQKRAAGVDASQGAEVHSFDPEDNKGSGTGTVFDTYAGMPTGEHPNVSGDTGTNGPLAVGQAPVAAARPVRGSKGVGEQFNPAVPNQIMQSPVVRGVTKDDRNDPLHPEHEQADKKHPDYGKPVQQHKGIKAEAPSMLDTAPEEDEAKTEAEGTALQDAKAQPGAAVA